MLPPGPRGLARPPELIYELIDYMASSSRKHTLWRNSLGCSWCWVQLNTAHKDSSDSQILSISLDTPLWARIPAKTNPLRQAPSHHLITVQRYAKAMEVSIPTCLAYVFTIRVPVEETLPSQCCFRFALPLPVPLYIWSHLDQFRQCDIYVYIYIYECS